MKKNLKTLGLISCECGYNNQPANIKRYGTCTGCGKVLDGKAKLEYEMYCRLKLWRYHKKRGGKI